MKDWKQGKWHVDRSGTFRCSAACNLFTFFFFFFARKPWDCLHGSAIARSGASTSYFWSLLGLHGDLSSSFLLVIFATSCFRYAQTDPRSLHVDRVTPASTGWSKLIGAPLPQPRPSTCSARVHVSAFTNHTLSSFIAAYCENEAEIPL